MKCGSKKESANAKSTMPIVNIIARMVVDFPMRKPRGFLTNNNAVRRIEFLVHGGVRCVAACCRNHSRNTFAT